MDQRMSRFGVGPLWGLSSILYCAATFVLRWIYPDVFQINFIPGFFLIGAGSVLLVAGIPFYIIAGVSGMKAYNQDVLCTTGIYGCCRHPIYASWVVFIVPGIMLLANSWIGLTAMPFMYVLLRLMTRKEDDYLENKFGTDFVDYKNSVPAVFPFGRKFFKDRR